MAQEMRNYTKPAALAYGDGTMSYDKSGKIIYKKIVHEGGNSKRICVRGDSVSQVLKKMFVKEDEFRRQTTRTCDKKLSEGLYQWLVTYRQPALKPKSYDRVVTTYKQQILPYPIFDSYENEITSDDIQAHLQSLVDKNLSWSTIKKVYDLLNSYLRFEFEHNTIVKNPMVDVVMPIKDNVLKQEKEIVYMTKDEVRVFCGEAMRLCATQNKPLYQSGGFFVLIIYTGIRVGELLALRWKDIDFNKKTMLINKSIEEVINREYDENNPDRMKELGITRRVQKIGSTKNHSRRLIALNTKALDALYFIKKYSQFTSPDDFVAATKHGKCNNEHNLYRRLSDILKRCDIPINQSGCHMLRHTCASLLFENGLPVEIIASILGHSPEVCRKTYIHFCQEQQAQAIHRIAEFNI